MAAIAQRLLNAASGDTGGFALTDEEKRQLIEASKDVDTKLTSLKKDEE
jgi:hypothetical protein